MSPPPIPLKHMVRTVAFRSQIAQMIDEHLVKYKIMLPYGGFPFGLRMMPGRPNKFDDVIGWYDSGEHEPSHKSVTAFVGTTDPGKFYLNNPGRSAGTAVMKDNFFHSGIWKIGLHKGERPALVQCAPITVFRDDNKDDVADLDVSEGPGYGINMHDTATDELPELVNKYSAGCQVVSRRSMDQILTIANFLQHKGVESFSYLLLRVNRNLFNIE